MPSPLLTIMMGLMFMKPFRDINRILSQLLEIANVLIALPLGGLIFMVCVDELRGNTSIEEINIYVIAGVMTLIWIALVNGSIALALEKRRYLEALCRSVDEFESKTEAPATQIQVIMPDDAHSAEADAKSKSAPKPKTKAGKKSA